MTTDSADRVEWLKQPEAEARRGRQTTKSGRTAANNRTARPQTGGLFRPHSLHLGKVVQMTPNDQKEKEVWEADRPPQTSLCPGKTKTTSSACEKSSMKSSRFNHTENHT